MTWIRVEFMVQVESEESFWAEFDEGAVAFALPGNLAYLIYAEKQKSVTEAMRAKWRRLRGGAGD
jgi:hypothetical protein